MGIFLLLAMLGWLYSNIYYTITINRLKKQNKEFIKKLKQIDDESIVEAYHRNRVMNIRNRIKQYANN